MKWFLNMKISIKLISSFVVVAIIAGVIGFVGYINISDLGNREIPKIHYIQSIKTDVTQVASMANMLLSNKLEYEEKQDKYNELKFYQNRLNEDIAKYNEIKKTEAPVPPVSALFLFVLQGVQLLHLRLHFRIQIHYLLF